MSKRGAFRILQLIEWMAAEPDAVSFAEVVAGLDLPKSSALDLLRLLVEAGYAEKTAQGLYRLTRLPGEPDGAGHGWGALLRHAKPRLQEAVDVTQESGFVAVLTDDLSVRYILSLMPEREIRYDRDVSVTRRPHLVSSGIVLLGALSEARLRDYAAAERAAGRYVGTDEALIEKVAAARAAGFQTTEVGVVEGAGGMAAPIRGRHGQIVAALNIAGPAHRVARAADTIEPVLCAAAAAVSHAIVPQDV